MFPNKWNAKTRPNGAPPKNKPMAPKPPRKKHQSANKPIDTGQSREELFVALLLRTSIRLQISVDRRFLPFGITAQEAAVLVRCVDAEEISAGKLAQAMNRDKGKISRFVDRLEVARFLTRKGDPRDHRLRTIKPTARGRHLAAQLKHLFAEIHADLFTGIMTVDVEQLKSVLEQLVENAANLNRTNALAEDQKEANPFGGLLPPLSARRKSLR